MRRQKFHEFRLLAALGAILLCALAVVVQPYTEARPASHSNAIPGGTIHGNTMHGGTIHGDTAARKAALGVFVGSDERGTSRLPGFERWLGRDVTVGRTYIPGESWSAFLGPDFILKPWTQWRAAKPGRILAINVPMVAPNEGGLPDSAVSVLLKAGAGGAFDLIFRQLARRLVAEGAGDSIIVLGWEMNGTTYSSRCAPDPSAWKRYWRQIVASMRSVQGERFRFDFTANRGRDAIAWSDCYPGDDVVDIIGLDSYDQPPSEGFSDYISQPYGLQYHADFAAAHGKPMSFPEWGLFRYGDRPQYVRQMLDWIGSHDVLYHSLSDYCPHGVWQCGSNPRSSEGYRSLLRQMIPTSPPGVVSTPSPSVPTIKQSPTPPTNLPITSLPTKLPTTPPLSKPSTLPTTPPPAKVPVIKLPSTLPPAKEPVIKLPPTPSKVPSKAPVTPMPFAAPTKLPSTSTAPAPLHAPEQMIPSIVRRPPLYLSRIRPEAQAQAAQPTQTPIPTPTPAPRAGGLVGWIADLWQNALTLLVAQDPPEPGLPSPAVMPPATPPAREPSAD